jgi:hypothetical protein
MGGGAPNSLYHDSTGWRAQDFVTLLSQVAPASISMNDMADGLLGTTCLDGDGRHGYAFDEVVFCG